MDPGDRIYTSPRALPACRSQGQKEKKIQVEP